MKSYKELIAWQKSMALVSTVYRISGALPKTEIYGLTGQMRRAAVSIPSNIAEGQARLTTGEFLQFLGHARGSLMELETQILISIDLTFLSTEEAQTVLALIDEVGRLLNALIVSLKRTPESVRMPKLATNH